MSMKQSLIDFYRACDHSATESLELFLHTTDAEALHNLRLSIKKLRVFLGFLSPWNDKLLHSSLTFHENAEIVFKSSGRSRDLFLQQQYLGKVELILGKPFPEYHAFINDHSLRKQNALIQALADHDIISCLPGEPMVRKAVQYMSVRGLERTFHFETEVLYGDFIHHCSLWEADEDPEHLHKARRHIKALMYLLNMTGRSKVRIQGRFRTLITLKRTEQAIGNWHDRLEALHSLMMFLKIEPPRRKRMRDYEDLEQKMAELAKEALESALNAARVALSSDKPTTGTKRLLIRKS